MAFGVRQGWLPSQTKQERLGDILLVLREMAKEAK